MKVKDKERLKNPLKGWPSYISSMVFHTVHWVKILAYVYHVSSLLLLYMPVSVNPIEIPDIHSLLPLLRRFIDYP